MKHEKDMETLGSNPEKDTDDILKRKRDQARRESQATQDQTKETRRAVSEERQADRQSASESDAKAKDGGEASVDQDDIPATTTEVSAEAATIEGSSKSDVEVIDNSAELHEHLPRTGEEDELQDVEKQAQTAEELTQRVDSLLETVAQRLSDKEEATNEKFRNIRKVTSTAAPAAAFDVTTGEVREPQTASEEFEGIIEDAAAFDETEHDPDGNPVVASATSSGGGFRPPILPPNPGNPASPNFGTNTVVGAAVAVGAGAALATAGVPPIPGLREVTPMLERRRRNSPVGPFLLGLGVGWLLKRRSANRRINSLNKELKTSSEQLKKSKQETELLLIQKKKSNQQKAEFERARSSEQQESRSIDNQQEVAQQSVDTQAPAAKAEVVRNGVLTEIATNVSAKVDSLEKSPSVAAKTPEQADLEKYQSTEVLQQIISREAALTDRKEAQGVSRTEIEHSLKQELSTTSDVAEKILQDKSPDWVVAVQLAVDRKSNLPRIEQWQVAEIRKKHPELYEKLTKRADAGVLLGAAGGYTPLPLAASKTSINSENVLPSPSNEPQLLQQVLHQDKQSSFKTLPIIVVFVVVVGVVLFLSLK